MYLECRSAASEVGIARTKVSCTESGTSVVSAIWRRRPWINRIADSASFLSFNKNLLCLAMCRITSTRRTLTSLGLTLGLLMIPTWIGSLSLSLTLFRLLALSLSLSLSLSCLFSLSIKIVSMGNWFSLNPPFSQKDYCARCCPSCCSRFLLLRPNSVVVAKNSRSVSKGVN